ncbi:ATP-dependent zinc metalloprotease FtsH [Candidatus Uhrbacteria bacterium]|nr:ATP-dependent zinc metalloprotease FtsH [Candidatus Uhrbacteria bacterium]
MRNTLRNIILFLIVLVALGALMSTYNISAEKPTEIGIVRLVEEIQLGEVRSISIDGNKLTITRADNKKEISYKEQNEPLSDALKNYGLSAEKIRAVQIGVKHESGFVAFLSNFLPFLLPFLLIGGFIFIMMRQVQGANTRAMSFGQSGAREISKDNRDRITFKDVAGVKEAKAELEEIVDFLKTPKKFIALGAKIPKGVLLMGSPGTGKTLLARAVAGEANVPFFHISGSEFVEMFVGVGAARVRDLFARAKKSAPCIIFVDEIDAVGRQRGAGLGGSHDEREQTLNQILVEMDGFDPTIGIIVIAATNRPDVLDPALLRPGRFDRRIVLDEPDINDREAILKIHSKTKPLEKDVNLRRLAERTPGFSGADLANLMNEAALFAARQNKKQIGMGELLESIEKVLLGPERKSHLLSEKERRVTAYHEAGHALVAHELPHSDPVHKVSIISRGRAAGYTLKLPSEDKHLRSREEYLADIAVSLGGFVAEKEIIGDITTGPSNDLKSATRMARDLVTRYGMSEALGPRTFGEREEMIFLGREIHEQRDYSEKIAEKIDEEVTRVINNGLKTAQDVIRSRRDKLDLIVNRLLEKETLEKEEFEALFEEHFHEGRLAGDGSAPKKARRPKLSPAPQAI